MPHEVKPLSPLAQSLKLGIYRHFKGGMYEVVGIGRLSEDREQEMVIYKSLENGTMWIRPLEMFLEHVEREGYSGPRFAWVKEKE